MRINTLRRLDIWIGRPLCWILTVAYKLKRLFIKKGDVHYPRKILFIKLFGMGSIILAAPSLQAVKKKYPDASLFFLTFKENESILRLLGVVPADHIYTVRRDSAAHVLADVARCLVLLARKRIDVVVDFEFFSRFTAILSFFIRSKYRIGFYGFHTEGLKRGSFINFPINYNYTLHTARSFFTLLAPLGILPDDYRPSLPAISPSERRREKFLSLVLSENPRCDAGSIAQWVLVNPNSSDLIELRKWPREHFEKLIALLLTRHPDLGIVLIGGREDRLSGDALAHAETLSGIRTRVVNLAGRTTIDELIDLFHSARLFITNDSGPAHLASLTSIPSIVLFGPETPALYAPLGDRATCLYRNLACQPCVTVYNGKRSYCHDNICLQQITPESVFEIAVNILDRTSIIRSPA